MVNYVLRKENVLPNNIDPFSLVVEAGLDEVIKISTVNH